MKFSLTILLICFVQVVIGQANDKYEKYADSLLKENKSKELISFFESELKVYPNDKQILRWLGYIYLLEMDLAPAEKYYNEALKVNANCERCFLNLGRIYAEKRDFVKALEFVNKAITMKPNESEYYMVRASIKEISGDKFAAFFDFNKAIELEPTNPHNYFERGLYYSRKGNFTSSTTDLTKAISLDPTVPEYFIERAKNYLEQGENEMSLIDVNQAIDLDTTNLDAYVTRGVILQVSTEYEKAIIDFSKAISIDPELYYPYMYRARVNYEMENMDATCKDYFNVRKLIEDGKVNDTSLIKEVNRNILDICDPSLPSYYYQRGVAYYNLNEFQKAVDSYSEGINKFPEDAMSFSFRGNAYMKLLEFEKALKDYYVADQKKDQILHEIRINPRHSNDSESQIMNFFNSSIAINHFNISECKMYLNLPDEALIEANKGFELMPDIPEIPMDYYYLMRSRIYMMLGNYDLAMTDVNKCLQLNPLFADAYLNRAIIKMSNLENVQTSYRQIGIGTNSLGFLPVWKFQNKSAIQKGETVIFSALQDCDKAINLDKNLGNAYLIRGLIKQNIPEEKYCMDFLTARELGVILEDELIEECLK